MKEIHELKKFLSEYDTTDLTHNEKIKLVQLKILIEMIISNVYSRSRTLFGHKSENPIALNKIILANCAFSEANCDKHLERGFSCINLIEKKLTCRKNFNKNDKTFVIDTVFDLNYEIIGLIRGNVSLFNKDILFTNQNNEPYPIFYKQSSVSKKKKRFNGFEPDYIKLILKYLKKMGGITDERMYEISNYKIKDFIESWKSDGTQQEKTTQKITPLQWQEIIASSGVEKKDCICGAYGRCVFERIVVQKKTLRGLRPIHDNNCDKILK